MINNKTFIVLRYIHTIRYLKFKQIFYRIFRHVFFRYPQPKKNPKLRNHNHPNFHFLETSNEEYLGNGKFIFLNKHLQINQDEWNSNEAEKLWLYNLHYFNYLLSPSLLSNPKEINKLVNSWIKNNKRGEGLGWDPYPSSLRITNWIKCHLMLNNLTEVQLESLYSQAQWLSSRIEFHLLGNHLIANAKALIFSGILFSSKEADLWLEKGVKLLTNEIKEQILDDGGHFELSPMYHSIILEDFLDILSLFKSHDNERFSAKIQLLENKIEDMFFWLNCMIISGNRITHFNDSTQKVSKSLQELKYYAEILDIPQTEKLEKENLNKLTNLNSSGYIRINTESSSLLLDVGKVGPDYIPGHAHADSLSFELSVFGNTVIVNGGTSTYKEGKRRDFERSSLNHSTIVIDSSNSSDVWKSFRVGKRAVPYTTKIIDNENKIEVSSGHDGYLKNRSKTDVYRTWISSNKSLVIHDFINGKFREAFSQLIFDPQIKIEIENERRARLTLPDGNNIFINSTSGNLSIKQTSYAEEFGRISKTSSLRFSLVSGENELSINW